MTNSKTTKRALFSSVVALLLCFTMLLGTTFAWFTDTASTGVNTIQAGTLQVALQDSVGNSLEGQTLTFVQKNATGETTITNSLWEPNATFITQQFKIVNEGSLYLKYTIVINGIDGDAKLNEVMEWSVIDGAGNAVTMTGTLAPHTASELMNLKVHMLATATNEYQGLSMNGIGITVYATQAEAEYDRFGNQYDKDASYTKTVEVNPATAQDVLNTVEDGTIVKLTAGDYGKLMLQSAYVGEARTIKNLTIKGTDGVNVAGIEVGNKTTLNNVVIDSINFTGAYDGFQCNVGDAAVDGLTINNCTMTDNGTAQFVSIKSPSPKNVKITNCTVDGAQRLITMVPSNNVTITGNTMQNLTVHGILLDNSGGRYHTGTIVIADNAYDRGAGECFIRIANLDATNTLIIKDNTVTNYMAGTSVSPYEDTYIKITTANGEIDIMGNTATDASALGGYPLRGDLYISVNGERYVQLVPQS